MYTAFHNLVKKPFSMTADPSFLFVTKQHREALVGLTSAILDRKGVLVLSGMAGSGKTTLLSWVLQKLACDKVRTTVILNPTLTRDEFIEMVMLDFGITNIPASKAQRLWMLQNYLVAGIKEGKINVLIVDEAHKLSYDVLEEIRLLGNLECGPEKMLQILLLGQSELDDILGRPELWQFKQRIGVRLTIDSLAPNEVEPYIQHRWAVAGGQQHPFDADAIDRIRKYSKGVPRLINAICDNALTEAFADESRTVKPQHVDAAATDLLLIEKPKPVAIPVAAPAKPAIPVHTAAPLTQPASSPAPPPAVNAVSPKPTPAPVKSMVAIAPGGAPGSTTMPAGRLNGTAAAQALSIAAPIASAPPRRKRWFLLRWAGKLGLNGYGDA